MKVIFSRKGFDSEIGGYPSIIMDSRLVSLPVPSRRVDEPPYSTLILDMETSYFKVMSQLSERIKIKGKREAFSEDTRCHCDPDIYQNVRPRKSGWRGCFGQAGNAQRHLESRIKENDVFLFFGWFKNVKSNGKYAFDNSIPHGRHVIFGYLQIANMLHPNLEKEVPAWMEHPHIMHKGHDEKNTIYVATEKLSWNEDLPGWGVFNFDKKLVLTKKGILDQNGTYPLSLKT